MKLQPIAGERGIYTAKVNGKESIVIYTPRNRAKVELVNNSITIPHLHVVHGKKIGTEQNKPVYVAVSVTVGESKKFNQSWIVGLDIFSKAKVGESDFNLSNKARESYTANHAICNEDIEIVVPAETKPAETTKAAPAATATKAVAKPKAKKAA